MDTEIKLDQEQEKNDFENNEIIDLSNPQNNTAVSSNKIDQENQPFHGQQDSQQILNLIPQNSKEEFANNIITNVGSSFQKTWLDKILCCLNFLRPYFKINTKELLLRLKTTFIPINSNFYDMTYNNPDLYGPFWIYTTLIFVLAAAGSLSNYISGDSTQGGIFDIRVPLVGSIIYTIGFLVPFLLYLTFKFMMADENTTYINSLCLYGYSFAPFIPVLILCTIKINALQWILLVYGILNSALFISFNLWKILSSKDKKKLLYFFGGLAVTQIIVLLLFKYCLSYQK